MQKTTQKKQIFKKWDDFKKRPSCKGYSPWKGYSLCKMVSLGQKLKMPKTCEKWFYKNIRVVPCKKPLEKTPNIRKKTRFWKSPIWGNGYSLCKMVSLGQKIKMPKTDEERFYKNIRVVLWKKPLHKTPNIRQMRRFWKSPIWGKGYIAHAKGLAFAKWSVWVKNLKMPKTCEKRFYNNIRVVLCKEPLEKTPNIRQMKRFWKSPILQRL